MLVLKRSIHLCITDVKVDVIFKHINLLCFNFFDRVYLNVDIYRENSPVNVYVR